MKKLNQYEVNTILWRAYDSFKQKGDVYIIRDYVLVLFFLKYITDRSKDEDFDIISIDNKSSFDYIYSNRYSYNISDLINETLSRLEDNNKSRLSGVFRSLDYNCKGNFRNIEDRNVAIVKTLEDLNNLKLNKDNLENINIPANSFAQFIEITEFGLLKGNVNNYVPLELGELVVNLLDPKEGESIYNPSCGIGELLAISYNKSKNDQTEIFGQVKDEKLFRLCKLNMILNNIKIENIKLGDVIVEPLHLEGKQLKKFDVVFSYPSNLSGEWIKSFNPSDRKRIAKGEDLDFYNRFQLGVPPLNKSDYVYILHMLTTLSGSGRMATILYPGVLFRGGSERDIRKNIIDKNLLDAIIMLPERMLTNTGIQSVILLFQKNRKREDILMIDASLDKYIIKDRHINKLKSNVVEKIIKAYSQFEEYEGFSKKVNIEEIRNNDYNLHMPKYLLPLQEIERYDIGQIKHNILRIKAKLAEVEYEIEGLINREI